MIALGFTGCQHAPSEWEAKYSGIGVNNFPKSGTSRVVISAAINQCDQLVDELIESRFPVESFNFAWQQRLDWSHPEDCWAGAVVHGGEVVELAPDNEFSPFFGPQCYGMVPPYLPIHVLEQPRGHVVGARTEKLFAKPICEFIASRVSCDFAPVIIQGKTQPSHSRIVLASHPVLATRSFLSWQCGLCGTPLHSFVGVFVGNRMTDLQICESEQGMGHLGLERQYCVSVSVAQEMQASFIRRGYLFAPILDIDTPLAARLLSILKRMKQVNFICPQRR